MFVHLLILPLAAAELACPPACSWAAVDLSCCHLAAMARWLTRVLPLQARCPSLPAQPPLAGLLHLPRDPCLTRLASPTDRDLQEARQAKLAAKPLSAQALQEGMAAVRREDPLHTGHVRQNCGVCPACRQVSGCWGCGHGGACWACNCRLTRRAGRLATNGVDWCCCCWSAEAAALPPCALLTWPFPLPRCRSRGGPTSAAASAR